MTQAQIKVLGTISGCNPDGRPLRFGSTLVQRLVAVLVTEQGRPISRDRLIEVLWADSPPEGAQHNLQVYISRLRSGWGRDSIETSTSGYALAQTVRVDAALFERLITRARSTDLADALAIYDESLALWRGRAFGALADEWWARPNAVRLEELRLAAMTERVEVLLAVGEADRAAADSEVLLAADPLKEPSAIIRMRALHQSGRSAEALRVSAAFRRRLSEHAGLSASPALGMLERQILDHDPAAARPTITRAVRGYVFGDLLSTGGQGAVYEATQPSGSCRRDQSPAQGSRRQPGIHPPLRGRGSIRCPPRASEHRAAV
jgi:DNA-binding SARP family transcriptional activator